MSAARCQVKTTLRVTIPSMPTYAHAYLDSAASTVKQMLSSVIPFRARMAESATNPPPTDGLQLTPTGAPVQTVTLAKTVKLMSRSAKVYLVRTVATVQLQNPDNTRASVQLASRPRTARSMTTSARHSLACTILVAMNHLRFKMTFLSTSKGNNLISFSIS